MRRIPIDPDIWVEAKKYVDAQFQIMRDFGSLADLTPDEYDETIYKCAEYPQKIRNQIAKNSRQKAQKKTR